MPQEEQATEDGVKTRAFKRVAFAGVLALVAAIGLTMMSRSHKPVSKPQATALPAEPAAVLETPAPAPVSAVAEAAPETPPESDASPTVAPPPPPPQVINPPAQEAPRQAAKPHAAPSGGGTELAVKPVRSVAGQGGKPPASQELVATSRESVREALAAFNDAPAIRPAAPPPAAQKPAETAVLAQKMPETAAGKVEKVAEKAPAKISEKTPPAGAAQAAKGYAVQLGVFSNPANAVQMQEKLSQHGIRSYTETRLHVGPFQNKVEAEQAQARLRGLGISAVVVSLAR